MFILQKKGECLVKIVGRYGMSEEVLSDNGPQFTSNVIQTMMTAMDVNHVYSTPYHHQGNGHVVRCNREVIKHLRNIVLDEEVYKDWSRYILKVQYILNSSPHSGTGYSPIQLLFGNSITVNRATPHHAFTPDEPDMTIDYYQQKCIRVEEVLRSAREQPEHSEEFFINEWILMKYPTQPPPQKAKSF